MTAATDLTPPAADIAFHLRQGLDLAGLSQRRLAKLLGLDESYMSRLARGLFCPSWGTAVRIADAAGVSLDVFRTNPPPIRMEAPQEPKPKRRRAKKGKSK